MLYDQVFTLYTVTIAMHSVKRFALFIIVYLFKLTGGGSQTAVNGA